MNMEHRKNSKTELIVKCIDNCSCVSVDKWDDEQEYYFTFFKSYSKKKFWERVKDMFKVLKGDDVHTHEIILNEEDYEKLRTYQRGVLKVDRNELYTQYMQWAETVYHEFEFKTQLTPDEIVSGMAMLIEENKNGILKREKDDTERN